MRGAGPWPGRGGVCGRWRGTPLPAPPPQKKNQTRPGRSRERGGLAGDGGGAGGRVRGREGWWQGRGERRGDSWSQAERGEPAWLLSAAVLRILG